MIKLSLVYRDTSVVETQHCSYPPEGVCSDVYTFYRAQTGDGRFGYCVSIEWLTHD